MVHQNRLNFPSWKFFQKNTTFCFDGNSSNIEVFGVSTYFSQAYGSEVNLRHFDFTNFSLACDLRTFATNFFANLFHVIFVMLGLSDSKGISGSICDLRTFTTNFFAAFHLPRS